MAEPVVRGIEHVGIAVRDANAALASLHLLGFKPAWEEEIEDGAVRSHVVRAGDTFLEVLESREEGSTLERFLDRRGEGLHHLCLRVGSLDAAIETVRGHGGRLVSDEPTSDLRGRRVFVHPASNNGVLTGLVELHPEVEGRREVNPGWASYDGFTFSPAVIKEGQPMFVSGLNAIDEAGELVAPGDIVGQARAIYEKLGALLAEAGATPDDVMKTTDYIITRQGYAGTAQVRRDFFGDHFPAATGVVVSELLGRGVLIEVDAVAVL